MFLNWNPIVYCDSFPRPLRLHIAPGHLASFPDDYCSPKDLSDHTDQRSFRVCGSNTCRVPPPVPVAKQPAKVLLPRGPHHTSSRAWAAVGRSARRTPGPHSQRCQSPPPHAHLPYTAEVHFWGAGVTLRAPLPATARPARRLPPRTLQHRPRAETRGRRGSASTGPAGRRVQTGAVRRLAGPRRP